MPTPPATTPLLLSTHPGSSAAAIAAEPDWGGGGGGVANTNNNTAATSHEHRTGFVNGAGRRAGWTHDGDDHYDDDDDDEFVADAMRKQRSLRARAEAGDLLNFVDVMRAQTDYRQHRPEVYPPGWRFVVRASEDGVKYQQDWPANVKRREQQEEQEEKVKKQQQQQQQQNGDHANESTTQDPEHDWRRASGHDEGKHHGAYSKATDTPNGDSKSDNSSSNSSSTATSTSTKTEYQRLREKYSPEEITLLRHLQHEATQTQQFTQNPGTGASPVAAAANNDNNTDDDDDNNTSIATADAPTPDNWIPRAAAPALIRRTGAHPLNAEAPLAALLDAGLITPNALHYVRNHGAVPRLYWDEHVLDVCGGARRIGMDELRGGGGRGASRREWESVNIPVALACDGNRRGELNLVRKSKGFDWGAGAVSCAYWKGVRVADVLRSVGVEVGAAGSMRRWVNFEGADEPSEGKYATCFPLEYVMDKSNDVLLAYEMNDQPLPPDHGFPVRLIVPGYVGGRSVKWLARIWVSEKENDSHYHIWDNRVLPAFITEKDGEFARTMFNHPSTACNEQNLNSVIVKPAQGTKLDVVDVLEKDTYRVEGYAYDGGGHEVQRVELSLDGGKTWLYCLRHFPDRPIRHGKKFWTWIHWHIDIDAAYFVRAESLTVRCFNVFKNTQPEKGVWNLMGMMNNGWYVVRSSTDEDGKLFFRHPYDQEGTEGGGWMKPSVENQLAAAKQDSGVPDKQFTREEIEKHNSRDDCWLVINSNVYDATSVLQWHPGGSAALLGNAGKLSLDVTSSFENVHDDYAHKKLAECAIGRVTDKAKNFMQAKAKAEAKKAASGADSDVVLNSKRWKPVALVKKKQLSGDTFSYIFQYRDKGSRGSRKLGLGTCQHIQFGIHMLDKMLIRSYTPTRPVTEGEEDGTFELTVKTYFPDENQPGGAFSSFLHELEPGEKVDVCGPTGEITYQSNGTFIIEGKKQHFKQVSLVLGGSGITPGYTLIKRIVEEAQDPTHIAVIDANKTENDILLREELNALVERSEQRVSLTHVLSHPKNKSDWESKGGLSGHVNADIIKRRLFEPGENSVVFLCGPPGMIQKAALPALKDWGYEEDRNCFGF